jgi:hypothetical protein
LENVNLHENYQLLIICDASSSTLIGDLASHEIEREYNKVRIHKSAETYKEKIQIESHHKLQKTGLLLLFLPIKSLAASVFLIIFFCFLRRSPLLACEAAYIKYLRAIKFPSHQVTCKGKKGFSFYAARVGKWVNDLSFFLLSYFKVSCEAFDFLSFLGLACSNLAWLI